MIYTVVSVEYKIQREGARAGTPNVFVVFAEVVECVEGTRRLSLEELLSCVKDVDASQTSLRPGVVLAGKTARNIDAELVLALKGMGYYVAVETSGVAVCNSFEALGHASWVTFKQGCNEEVRLRHADESIMVLMAGEKPDDLGLLSSELYVTPSRLGSDEDKRTALEWSIETCKRDPRWSLSAEVN